MSQVWIYSPSKMAVSILKTTSTAKFIWDDSVKDFVQYTSGVPTSGQLLQTSTFGNDFFSYIQEVNIPNIKESVGIALINVDGNGIPINNPGSVYDVYAYKQEDNKSVHITVS